MVNCRVQHRSLIRDCSDSDAQHPLGTTGAWHPADGLAPQWTIPVVTTTCQAGCSTGNSCLTRTPSAGAAPPLVQFILARRQYRAVAGQLHETSNCGGAGADLSG